MFEKIGKEFAHMGKLGKDNNFSCQDPKTYCDRFKNNIKKLISVADG